MLTRLLPGSVAVVAAFTMPEFSVGAGDLVDRGGFDDPPEPALKQARIKGAGPMKIGQAAVKPQLAGVRYAAILDLNLDESAPLALPPVMANLSAGDRAEPEPETIAAISAPVSEVVTPAFVPPPTPAPTMTPLPAQAEDRLELLAPASMPVIPVAAAVVPAVPEAAPVTAPAAMPPIENAPSLPQAENMQVAVSPAPVALPVPLAVPAAAAEPIALAAAPLPPVTQARSAARGMIEPEMPARIAAVPQPPKSIAAPPPMGAPAARPPVAAAAAAPVAVVAAPAMRAPVSVPAAVTKPVAATRPARPAASAPAAPAKAEAIAVPRTVAPALAAPPAASKPAMPEIASRLITRVDGKTAGAVDFQQTAGGLKVRLGSIVEVLADRYDQAQLARIRNSEAGSQYLSLAELQAQGVPISYDPVYDEFNVGLTDTRPKAARKVHIDQISAPHRGLDVAGTPQIPRPR